MLPRRANGVSLSFWLLSESRNYGRIGRRLNKTMPVDRILVVDDEETIREIVSSMLTTAGYKCRQAGSGMEALALLESGEEFELMLSDLMMAEPGRHWSARTNQRTLSRHARGDGHGGARYLGGAGRDPQRRLRLPAETIRARTTAGDRAPGAGESPAEAGEPRLPDQPGIAGGSPHRTTARRPWSIWNAPTTSLWKRWATRWT